ncbi:MAG: TAXI family TRAP transporter solute-binding subunit [Sphaerochaetaceae bacterium]|nr:TAXI family TRAP transporter solute-binding subunit [Spirochaetales bacterium]MDY5500110.1 TAXI family TRAP transporter solute-binding subunit [Sphaerochaetaceae bacterium]
MKKTLSVLLALTLLVSSVFAQGNTEGNASSPKRLTFGTSSSGGNFYLVGGGLSTLINNKLGDKFIVTAEETGGSTANLAGIEQGEMDLGIAMTSAISQGLDGTAKWSGGKKMENVRGLLPLYPSYMTVYTLASSPIKTLKDFKGHIVGLGSKGAAMDSVFREALPSMDAAPGTVFNDGHSATATAVGQGQVDAALLFSLPPFAAIAELEASHSLRFIPLTQDEINYLTTKYPFYSPAVMPKGSYKGVTEDVPTVSEWNMLVCSAKLSEDDVYAIVKMLLENNSDLVGIYKGLSYATADNEKFFNLPLHPGVVKYLKEIGIEVPANLIG